ncbi:transposase [Streptomyces sp. NPDC056480]|uniref:transposase n=1 Tax=Streptomyces sp. NPDC056480 TaxID=3345833 RepID=UPI00367A6E16
MLKRRFRPSARQVHPAHRELWAVRQQLEIANRSLEGANDAWLTATRTADLPRLHTFATGLEKDRDAVVQGLSTRWNSGPVEGRANHIKMIKRQMFGRAKLPLLRKRVLLAAAQGSHRHPLCP